MNLHPLRNNLKCIVKYLGIVIALGYTWYWRESVGELITFLGDREAIVAYLQPYQGWGPCALAIILGLQVFLAVIPGHAFMVAGGYLYGFIPGTLITQTSTVIASQLAYLLSRKFGKPFIRRIAPDRVIERWNRLSKKQGALFYFFSFILPIFPNDLMCFIAGLSSIKPKKFFIANFFGRLPCAVFITLIGSHGVQMSVYFWIVTALLLIGLCACWKQVARRLEQKFLPRPKVSVQLASLPANQ